MNKIMLKIKVNIKDQFKGQKGKEAITNIIGSKEAAAILGIHELTLLAWRKKGKIRFKKVGGTCVYLRIDVLALKNQIEKTLEKKEGGTHENK